MAESLQKAFFGVMALSLAAIAVELVPVSRQSEAWNRCLDTTSRFLSTLHKLQDTGEVGREAIAVNICNGAVHYNKSNK
ncbi:hypothetical protein [Prochlorococcus sp. MIT 1307]|uniref:hypothetical protein n=1 Tax=Prochlorococcus sp. MIT 1307 TaxID=3096219 RepID=UPI002A75A21E|nr:hypothetical protein [Prochlorococcus sp. MIT 1307]